MSGYAWVGEGSVNNMFVSIDFGVTWQKKLIGQHCAAYLSLKLVKANRFDRQTWPETIRWMQKTQKLWQFKPAAEEKILTNLATSYAPAKLTL